jgi:hypothetical protein
MPKVIPPPPPQPSESETKEAVRFVWLIMALTVVLFLGLSSCYHDGALMVQYGRTDAQSWNIHRAKNIDVADIREHPGGHIAWVIGSSILRESFDENRINQKLESQNSSWRIRKFGMTRGAAGVSSGILRHLPVMEGDLVIHSVAMGNFRKEWLDFNGLPAYRIMDLLTLSDFWAIDEWSLADKLEQTSAFPPNFYNYHESYMNGLTEWLYLINDGVPKATRPGFQTKFHRFETNRSRKSGTENPNYFPEEDIDFSEAQFNIEGLKRMRILTKEKGAELILIDIPPRLQYSSDMLHPSALAAWKDWRKEKQIEVWPQLREEDFYDLKHPNFRGRKILSQYMFKWLTQREGTHDRVR